MSLDLDEIEVLAKYVAEVRGNVPRINAATDLILLAEAVVAMLPVVRAAAAYRDAKDFDCYEATALEESIDTLRGKGEG